MVDQANIEHTYQFAIHVPHGNAEFVEGAKQLPTLMHKLGAAWRQTKAASAAFAESKAQPSFKGCEMCADGGLTQIESSLSCCNSPCIHDRQKQADEAQVEVKNVA